MKEGGKTITKNTISFWENDDVNEKPDKRGMNYWMRCEIRLLQ